MSKIRHFLFVFAFAIPVFGQAEECSPDLLMSYYPEQYVSVTLDKYQVPEEQQLGILSQLESRDKEVVRLVEERAAKMTPNPLRDPALRQDAVKIFRDTLYEQFAEVMNAHGVTDREQIQGMLDDIQRQKAEQFARCLEKQKEEYGDPEFSE